MSGDFGTLGNNFYPVESLYLDRDFGYQINFFRHDDLMMAEQITKA